MSRLHRELAHHVRGEVRFDLGYRAMYATGPSNYRQLPHGVICPRDVVDVLTALAICREHAAPVLSRGGGTGLAGQTCNEAVVFDFSKFVRGVRKLDPGAKTAEVFPGTVLDVLRDQAEQHGLTFGPDPATHNHCTFGGMIGNNSCGVHSVYAGQTADNVDSLDVVTYDGTQFTAGATRPEQLAAIIGAGGRRGEIYARVGALATKYADAIRRGYPKIPRRVSGYNLPWLLPENGFHLARALVGSEGTLVTVLRAKVRLVHSPRERVSVVLGYPDVYSAADHVLDVLESGPIGLEAMDDVLIADLKLKHKRLQQVGLLPDGNGWLLVEFGGDSRSEAEGKAHALLARLKHFRDRPSFKLFDSKEEAEAVWKVREAGLGATARVPGQPDTWEGWEDAAVPPEALGDYLRNFRALLDRNGFRAALYGHFGQGCVHTRIPFDFKSADGVKQYRRFVEDAAELVVHHGGSLSGEHGDGQSRAELLPKMFGPELIRAMEELKDIFDPTNMMNPHKVVRAYKVDQNLKFGPDYRPRQVSTRMHFSTDRDSFAQAAERCVGVGECRRMNKSTMCPSYRATREEQHSTRGRAITLFEMMRGTLPGGWKSDAVRESLELCLSCKGCKSDCPVNVDMAAYKSEFLSHYYEGRLRPRHAYVFGWIRTWARLGSLMPGLVNALTRMPLLSRLLKWLGGIDQRRSLPKFSSSTFRTWFRERPRRRASGHTVMLWPDTFNDHFQPKVLVAATEVLEAAGLDVMLPPPGLCCGRPLYDYGMLDTAKARLEQILQVMKPAIDDNIPIVGVEPSCVAVFKDELLAFFPERPDALALSRLMHGFDEYVSKELPQFAMLPLERDAVVHGHCHQKALQGLDATKDVLERAGVKPKMLDSGCCGMAGGFGYEKGHYEVSQKSFDLELLPHLPPHGDETLLVADGFSCREQVEQEAGRQAVHTAQVLQMAIRPAPLMKKAGSAMALPASKRRRFVYGTLISFGVLTAGATVVRLLRGRKERV
ncbi:MAG: FAD-binding and (Fe-S)-binding domain-containing protein [Myxococcaceae bacterium]